MTAIGGLPGARFPGERSTTAFVAHETFETYVSACTAGHGADDIPVYTGHPSAGLALQGAAAHLTHLTRSQKGSTSTLVLSVKGSPAAVCAYLLASRTGAELLLLDDLAQFPLEEDRPTCLVALSEAIGDDLLTELLRRMTRPCRDRRPWNDRSGDCFVTAGDLAGLSRYVARLIAATWEEPGSGSFHMIVSDSRGTEHSALMLGEDPRVQVRELAPDAVGSVIAQAEGVIAFYGHGGDACAYAGGVTVLCGRRAHALGGAGGGTLACRDEGAGCPRGPLPMPMATLRAQHVMQTSCSSARLADSALTPAFNLLLSFVDGEGLSHVGMAMAGGRLECCVLYLAAMAEGKTLGETLMLMNCFLQQTGLDQPVYVGLGLPELRAGGRRSDAGNPEGMQSSIIGTGGEFSCDFGARNFGSFLLSDPILVDLAGSGRLTLALDGPAEAMWFCRLEESAAEGDASLRLRVFVFSFPEPLGCVRFTPFDSAERTRSLHAKLGSLRRWIDYHHLIAGAESEGATLGAAAYDSFRHALPASMNRMRAHGAGIRALEALEASLDHTRTLLRDLLLAELAPRLSGPFWLSNSLYRDQYFMSADPSLCPACGGRSFRRQMVNHLSEERRSVHVCMRCGIVDDFRTGSRIVQALVSCPTAVERGGSLSVLVEVQGASQLRECFVLAGISGPYLPKVESQLFQAEVLEDVARVSFTFEVPRTMPLHEFRWKCVVADDDDIAFVSRNVFVVDERPS